MSENLITKEMLVELSTNFKSLVETYKKFRLFKNRKSLSEDMSGLLETIVSDYYDCVQGYERDVPKLLRNKTTKGLYVNACLLRKGWGKDAITQAIRDWIL